MPVAEGTTIDNGLVKAGKKPSPAVGVLANSSIDPKATRRGLMGDDIDMHAIRLYIAGKLKLKLFDQLLDVQLNRSIKMASTLEVQLEDYDRTILNSGLLSGTKDDPVGGWLDFNLDGLWFRMINVKKGSGDDLTLVFEQREISVLRLYNLPKLTKDVTRAEFILSLIQEIPIKIPYFIPELHTVQPQVDATSTLTVAQMQNPQTGSHAPYKTASPLPGNDTKTSYINQVAEATGLDPRVVAAWAAGEGHPGDFPGYFNYMNITTATAHSLGIPTVGTGPAGTAIFGNMANGVLAAAKEIDSLGISSAGTPRDQIASIAASRWAESHYGGPGGPNLVRTYVSMFGEQALDDRQAKYPDLTTPVSPGAIPGGPSIVGGTQLVTPVFGSDTVFYRGVPMDGNQDWGLEDSWTCIQRLADEVHWYAFFVGGEFWYVQGATLLAGKPIMNVDESSAGIVSIEGDYDRNKKNATITVTCRTGRWSAPPGAVVVLQHLGPFNGRWIVTEFQRSLFDLEAQITLTKPAPELPEPPPNNNLPGITPPVPAGPSVVIPGVDGSGSKVLPGKGACQVLNAVQNVLGTPYVWGGKELGGFDCSGLMWWAYRQVGVKIDRTSEQQWASTGVVVDTGTNGVPNEANLSPGDLVFFEPKSGGPGHVAMYIGGGKIIAAPNSTTVVQVQDLMDISAQDGYVGAKRVIVGGCPLGPNTL